MEKKSGKKCWMLSARKLEIVWVDSPEYWLWISIPDSRFNTFISMNILLLFNSIMLFD